MKLTNRLVDEGGGRGRAASGGSRRRGPASERSRDRIFAAAAHEFAARGFAGASVDRIAAAARLNKAMIYYHFSSKAALYREILREMFRAVGASVAVVAASDAQAADKIRRFIDAFAAAAEARPHFPPIWFREIAEGGAHLDDAILRDMAGVVKSLIAIVDGGVRAREFQAIPPLLLHAGIVAPVLLFFASANIRRRMQRVGVRGVADIDRDAMVAHIQRVSLGLLQGRV